MDGVDSCKVGNSAAPPKSTSFLPFTFHLFTPFCTRQSTLQPTRKMAPLVPLFSAATLPDHVNTIRRNFYEEKRRKGDPVELSNCPLFEMVQYSCNPPQDGIPQPGVIVCKPVVRLFRRYSPSLGLQHGVWGC